MKEYDLHTQGAAPRRNDAYDGNDPNRNRASSAATDNAFGNPDLSSGAVALTYTTAMGEAAQRYIDTVLPGNWLGARFRWQDVWRAMVGAMPGVAQVPRAVEQRRLIQGAIDDGAQAAASEAGAVPYEKTHAIKEGERNDAEFGYFAARPKLDTPDNRRIFCAGFDRGYDVAPPAPVEAGAVVKDISKMELRRLWNSAGGMFHGPKIETASMPEEKLFQFLRALMKAAPSDAPAQQPALEPVHGDVLPPIGSRVEIHLASIDKWAPHTVVGYYAWGDLHGNSSLHRVFVRVRSADGYLNARLLKDVRPLDSAQRAPAAQGAGDDGAGRPCESCGSPVKQEWAAYCDACMFGTARTAQDDASDKDAGLEAAAIICDEMAEHWAAYKDTALLNGDVELSNAASGEPRAATMLAKLIRERKSGVQRAAPQGDA